MEKYVYSSSVRLRENIGFIRASVVDLRILNAVARIQMKRYAREVN